MNPFAGARPIVLQGGVNFGERSATVRIALWIFVIHVALVSPTFFPSLEDIGVWDEAFYINSGRALMQGQLPQFAYSPAAAGLYALTYLPVHNSPRWLIYSCAIGRFVLFTLLWVAGFRVATRLPAWANPLVLIALLTISPLLVELLNHGGNALFAAMSGFALAEFLSFQRTRQVRHLWQCSAFVGLAALSRPEGMIVFLVFVALTAVAHARDRLRRQALAATLLPFCLLVGGYVLLVGLRTGDYDLGTKRRSYFTFEQGHGIAFREAYGDREFYLEGQLDSRRLFGTPAENNNSVWAAIRRNPHAYIQRIPGLAKGVAKDAFARYDLHFGLLCFAFALRGCIELINRRSFLLMATLLLWPAYAVLYVLLCYQPSHLLLPYLSVFALAAVGISALIDNLGNRRERTLWTVALVAVALAAAARGKVPNNLLAAATITLGGLWLTWRLTDASPEGHVRRFIAAILLLSVAFTLRLGSYRAPLRAPDGSAEEHATRYLSEHFAPGSAVAAWAPGRIWAARMAHAEMTPNLRGVVSSEQLWEWMEREQVKAIFVDDYLRRYEPELWNLIQRQIGSGLEMAFVSTRSHDDKRESVLVLVRTPAQ